MTTNNTLANEKTKIQLRDPELGYCKLTIDSNYEMRQQLRHAFYSKEEVNLGLLKIKGKHLISFELMR